MQMQARREASMAQTANECLLMDAVVSHLEQTCCWRTVQALRCALDKHEGKAQGGMSVNVESMQQREEVGHLIRDGKIAQVRPTHKSSPIARSLSNVVHRVPGRYHSGLHEH